MPELLDRPPLGRDEQWLMDAFERLSTERHLGFGAWGHIPHSAVVEEALRLGYAPDGDAVHEMWTVIHDLDEQWRAVVNKAPAEGTGAGSGRLSDKDNRRPVRRGRRKSEGGECD